MQESRRLPKSLFDRAGPLHVLINRELQDIAPLAANARHFIGRHPLIEGALPALLGDEQGDRLEEIVALNGTERLVLVFESLFPFLPIIAQLKVIGGKGGSE